MLRFEVVPVPSTSFVDKAMKSRKSKGAKTSLHHIKKRSLAQSELPRRPQSRESPTTILSQIWMLR
jgi:hypothetical protein